MKMGLGIFLDISAPSEEIAIGIGYIRRHHFDILSTVSPSHESIAALHECTKVNVSSVDIGSISQDLSCQRLPSLFADLC